MNKVNITDEAVQAALEYYSEGGCMGLDNIERRDVAISMLEAALPHLHVGYKVKQLEWDESLTALTEYGFRYTVYQEFGRDADCWAVNTLDGVYRTIETAKAAAQADFERRVRDCLVATLTNKGTKPVDVEAVRKLLNDIDELVANSGGVFGLHQNGDLSPWDELLEGGEFEGWLRSVEELRRALSAEFAKKSSESWYGQHAMNDPVPSASNKQTNLNPVQWLREIWHNRDLTTNDFDKVERALSAEPAQGEQWQPIETAPINQSILVHYDDGKIELINADDNDYAWVAYTGKQDFCTKPTHWMPLPTAPTSEAMPCE